jgi:hypothetical protein
MCRTRPVLQHALVQRLAGWPEKEHEDDLPSGARSAAKAAKPDLKRTRFSIGAYKNK